MGSLLDQLQKKSRVLIHISNPQIQQHQFAKMASFKILLVVALVAFIGSSDALKCKVGAGAGAVDTTCTSPNDGSCKIEATITITGQKGTIKSVAQSCAAKDLGKSTVKFVVPVDLHDLKEAAEVKLPYYCKADNCNVKAPIEAEIKTKELMAALLLKNPKEAEIMTGGPGAGAAQTSVAVATIAFSMVMARLAL